MEAPRLKHRHSHIYDKLKELWGTQECYDELLDYITYDYDPARGERQGFEDYIMTELLQMYDIHAEDFPHFIESCPWRTVYGL